MSGRAYIAFQNVVEAIRYFPYRRLIPLAIAFGMMAAVIIVVYQAVFAKVHCYYVVKDYQRNSDWSPPYCVNGMKWGVDEPTHGCYASYEAAVKEIKSRKYGLCGK